MSRLLDGTRLPAVGFASREIPPPGPLYIRDGDALWINSYASVASLVLELRGRLMLPSGEVSLFAIPHRPNSDRTSATTVESLREGFLLDAYVSLTSGTARRGQCFARVGLAQGITSARTDYDLLAQDYVGTGLGLSWRPGRIRSSSDAPGIIRTITGTDPAAGADISETVPTGARWNLLAMRAQLVTDATAANRRALFRLTDGTTPFSQVRSELVQTASQTITYVWQRGVPSLNSSDDGFAMVQMPDLPTLGAGFIILSATVNLQAADNWAAPILIVEEWIVP